jgi:ATP-dependent Clp protease ATP-binding subunit ClpB
MDMTTRSTQAVNSAATAAAERGNPAVEPVHLAVALLDDKETLSRPLLQAVGADPQAVRACVGVGAGRVAHDAGRAGRRAARGP